MSEDKLKISYGSFSKTGEDEGKTFTGFWTYDETTPCDFVETADMNNAEIGASLLQSYIQDLTGLEVEVSGPETELKFL
jgi:hypothetical protein